MIHSHAILALWKAVSEIEGDLDELNGRAPRLDAIRKEIEAEMERHERGAYFTPAKHMEPKTQEFRALEDQMLAMKAKDELIDGATRAIREHPVTPSLAHYACLELPPRARRAIERHRCSTLLDVTQITAVDLLQQPNFGATSLNWIREALGVFGLALKGENPTIPSGFVRRTIMSNLSRHGVAAP